MCELRYLFVFFVGIKRKYVDLLRVVEIFKDVFKLNDL